MSGGLITCLKNGNITSTQKSATWGTPRSTRQYNPGNLRSFVIFSNTAPIPTSL